MEKTTDYSDILINVWHLNSEDVQQAKEYYKKTDEDIFTEIQTYTLVAGIKDIKNDFALIDLYPEAFSLIRPEVYTDVGNAKIVARRNKGVMYFCDALGWMVYNADSGAWESNTHKAQARCIEYTDDLMEEAKRQYLEELDTAPKKKSGKIEFSAATKELMAHALKSQSRAGVQNMLELTKAFANVKANVFDADPYALNTPAGIVDLRTGETRPHDPKAFCIHTTAYAPEDKGAALWNDFIDLITCGDKDLALFLQLNAGMCAIGEITHEYTAFAIGGGRNGKSTYYGALSLVMGDYAGSIEADAITKKNENRFSFSGIRGKRLVTCGELEQGAVLSTKALKKISSAQDKFTLEQKYKDAEEVPRTFHLTLFTNFLPRVDAMDGGTWRRIKVIPFNATMPTGEKEIKDYSRYLADHAGGAILKWIIDGAVQFCKNRKNIKDPAAVVKATTGYKDAEDWLTPFLQDCCTVDTDDRYLRAGVNDLRKAWAIYAKAHNLVSRSNAEFDEAMENKGFKKIPIGGHRMAWQGVGINDTTGRTDPYKD